MRFHTLPALALVAAGLLTTTASASAHDPLRIGLHDPAAETGDASRFDVAEEMRPSIARVAFYWAQHVPGGERKPAGFDTADPADPHYDWASLDAFVRAAAARGIDPLITTLAAPAWAEGYSARDRARRTGAPGTYRVNPNEFGRLMRAMARRYSGHFPDPQNPRRHLPRVRYFQMWNEQNFGIYLTSRSKTEIPRVYVRLLNAGYDAVKRVSHSNVVVTGGLGPYGYNGTAVDVEPQQFMRAMLCLTGRGGRHLRERSRCRTPKPKFDVWAQHPYTFGGRPTTHGGSADSVALGDLPEVRRTVAFAVHARKVAPARSKKLWVSEFGWFTNPPGLLSGSGVQLGVSPSRQAAYLSETAYRVWRAGFSAFVWYGLDDSPGFPTGLVRRVTPFDPKPSFTAMRFPFYGNARRGRVLVWGIAPGRARARIMVERRSDGRWLRVRSVRSDARGMFYRWVDGPPGSYRAVVTAGPRRGSASLSFHAR